MHLADCSFIGSHVQPREPNLLNTRSSELVLILSKSSEQSVAKPHNGPTFTGRGRRPAFESQGPSWPRTSAENPCKPSAPREAFGVVRDHELCSVTFDSDVIRRSGASD